MTMISTKLFISISFSIFRLGRVAPQLEKTDLPGAIQ